MKQKKNITVEQIIECIKHDIINGQLKPGQKILEDKYAAKFEVSRTPVREALRSLATGMLVEVKKNIGATVKKYSLAELDELYDIRLALEKMEYEWVLRDMTESEKHDLEGVYAKLMACDTNDETQVHEVNTEFNDVIYRLLKANIIKQWMDRINDVFSFIRNSINWYMSKRWFDSVQEHALICQALIQRDHTLLMSLLEKHIITSKKYFLEFYKSYL